MDLSNTFAKLNNDLLLCKQAYDFDTNTLTFIKAIFSLDTKEQKWLMSLANGKKHLNRYVSRLYLQPRLNLFTY